MGCGHSVCPGGSGCQCLCVLHNKVKKITILSCRYVSKYLGIFNFKFCRYTEELFATLIAFIFIFNAFKNVSEIGNQIKFAPTTLDLSCPCVGVNHTGVGVNYTDIGVNFTGYGESVQNQHGKKNNAI